MDPNTKNDPTKMAKYPLVADILRRMDPPEVIKNPVSFYAMMIKPFLNRADAYRQYWPERMYNLKIWRLTQLAHQVTTQVLWKKAHTKNTTPKQHLLLLLKSHKMVMCMFCALKHLSVALLPQQEQIVLQVALA